MGICEDCGREMQTAKSCKFSHMKIKGKWYKRQVGDNGEWITGERCHDCGIILDEGNYHHMGCDNEYCPKCGGQQIMCDCEVEELATAEGVKRDTK